ncbi:MAG TPA: Gfo/Idh/MocA family oxidoreductase [Pyrinomonadaceae bacterium]|nr:Gfo/Idh/MocA family oxidoreductase [Pyrinomonadaceae bacterium]
MDKIKIGIIGTGYMGGTHAQIFARDERAEVSALFDIRPERMQRVARLTGARTMENAEQVIENSDAIVVTTPNTRHVELAISAARAGKHVLCEKPMATNLEGAKAVLEAANDSDSVFQVGHNRRYAPVYQKLKQLLSEDKPHSAHIKMNRGELQNPEWTSDTNVTGGFLYETTIHLFDMMRFQFGEVSEMIAFGSSHTYPEIDNFSVLLKFQSGLHATFCSSAEASWQFPFERVEVFCEHRTILTQEMETILDSRGTDANFQTFSYHMAAKEERWGYEQEDRAFIDAILNKTEPPVTALDGYKSVELVEACYRAVRSGERIRFGENAQ